LSTTSKLRVLASGLTIRPMRPADRGGVVELMAALQDHERQLHPGRARGAGMADQHLAHLETLVARRDGAVFVAELADVLIGFAVCFVQSLPRADRHLEEPYRRHGWLSDLYVRAEARRLGAAQGLVEAAEDHFRELGLRVLRLSTLASNALAESFYRAQGFTPVDVVYEKLIERRRKPRPVIAPIGR
jgi:ribosomal protein S18 acetylase RimI-like enzyme